MSTPAFCLYLWRSVNVPGLIYLAETFHRAQTLSAVLSEDGYIVKVVQLGTNEEYEIRDGVLTPRGVGSVMLAMSNERSGKPAQ
jgi:hypothetical protein